MNELSSRNKTAMMTKVSEVFRHLEAVVSECNLAALESQGQFSRALTLADGIQQISSALTTEVMNQSIMPLMNTPLGFLTDRDPNRTDGCKPYQEYVVRTCFVEAVLRGFMPVGNEFNIISSRCYGTKEGYARLVRKFPGLTDLKLKFDVPRLVGEKGAIASCSATWKVNGVGDSIQREFPIRVNSFMGPDAIIGKATRKLLASIYGQLTGSEYSLPDGDVDDIQIKPVDSIVTDPTKTRTDGLAEKLKTLTPQEPTSAA